MKKIILEIKKCWDGCPFCSSYNGMPKSLPNHFTCKKANKLIASYVEYPNEMPEVPDWCPISVVSTELVLASACKPNKNSSVYSTEVIETSLSDAISDLQNLLETHVSDKKSKILCQT